MVVYGAAAQNNWYPNEEARSVWDIDGTLHVQGKCAALWRDGYRLALAPDYAIEDGSFVLVTKDLLDGTATALSFLLDGKKYEGSHTGLLAYREDGPFLATKGSRLSVDGAPVALEEICTECAPPLCS